MDNTIYYQRGNGAIKFKYGRTGRTMTYMYYTMREAYSRFKQLVGVKRAHLEQVGWLIW